MTDNLTEFPETLYLTQDSEDSQSKGLTDFLFPAPAPRTTWGIVKWWERRRLHYNLIVGGTGLLSMGLFKLIAAIPPDPWIVPMTIGPVIAYGILANLCYLLGPTAEIAIEKLFRGKVLPTGPVLFRMGLTFAVGLTLLPTLVGAMGWVIRTLSWFF